MNSEKVSREWLYIRHAYNIALALKNGLVVQYNIFGQNDDGWVRVNEQFSGLDQSLWTDAIARLLVKGNFRCERRQMIDYTPPPIRVNTPDVVPQRSRLLTDAQVVGMVLVTVVMVAIFVFGPVFLN